ncbi:MAG: peptidoglycan-binding protein LysM [bacterium]|nr:peptidoglycan-binding protein LysM [bacterium]
MGIFDFVKEAGKNVGKFFDLAKEVQDLGIDIRDPEISYSEGIATAKGTVKSLADKEKIILTLGNVEGVEKVDDQLVVENQDDEKEAAFHTVKPGDSLSKIAKKHYGDPMKYMTIFEANKPMLKNPDSISVGQVLRIPEL